MGEGSTSSSKKRKVEEDKSLLDILRFDQVCAHIIGRLPYNSVEYLSYSCRDLSRHPLIYRYLRFFKNEQRNWKFSKEEVKKTLFGDKVKHILSDKKVCIHMLDKLSHDSVSALMVAYPHLIEDEFVRTYLLIRGLGGVLYYLQPPTTKSFVDFLKLLEPIMKRKLVWELGTLSRVFEDKIMHQILSYLPVKSLCKFKCVSKSWKLLHSNSSFVQLHLHQSKTSPQILISTATLGSITISSPKLGFEGGEAIFKKKISWEESCMLRPINGLSCFVSKKEYSIRISNISTRQETPRFFSSLPIQPRGTLLLPMYGFGFDPSTGKHKVICVWEISRNLPDYHHTMMSGYVEYICEVFSLGEKQWKKIHEVPPVTLHGHAVYANGSLYWRNLGNSYSKRPDKELIVAFDIGTEKFRVIQIPDFIVDTFRDSILKRAEDLLQVDGHIALTDRASSNLLMLWISNDNPMSKEMSTDWEEERIALPFLWEEGCFLSVNGIEGTKQLVIKAPILSTENDSKGFIDLWVYDRMYKSFQKINISGIYPELKSPYVYGMFIFHEGLLPIEDASAV